MHNERMLWRPRIASSLLGMFVWLLLALPVGAGDEYPATAFFLDGLTERSSWKEILAKSGVTAELPFVAFESTFVRLDGVCVDGAMLAVTSPELDTGVRVAATELRAQVEAATAGHDASAPDDQVAAATVSDPALPVAMRYPVWVKQVVERGILREHIYLVKKAWPIRSCPAR
jgi:hypothetical protein